MGNKNTQKREAKKPKKKADSKRPHESFSQSPVRIVQKATEDK